MDTFEELSFGQPEELDPSSFLVMSTPLTAPEAALRNRAASTAFLTGKPEDTIPSFQLMMNESSSGGDATRSSLKDSYDMQNKKMDMKGVMNVLGDPKIDFETKKSILFNIKQSKLLGDTLTSLTSSSLTAASAGENIEQEAARLTLADTLDGIYESRAIIQGLVNAHAAKLSGVSTGTFGEMLEQFVMPFGNTKLAGQIANEALSRTSVWDKTKSYLLPGSATMDMRKRLEGIPESERVAFTKSLIESISKNSGILFSNDNEFAQFEKAVAVFEEGGYSSFDSWMDNITPLLDVVGLGMLLRGGNRARKALNALSDPLNVSDTSMAPPVTKTTGMPTPLQSVDVDLDKLKPTMKYRQGVPNVDVSQIPKSPPNNSPRILGGSGTKPEMDKPKVAALLRRIEANNTVRAENPASVAKVVQQANPEQARLLHKAVVDAADDVASNALYGTNRIDAIASDIMPQASLLDGAVVSRVMDIDRNVKEALRIPAGVTKQLENTGATYFTEGEKAGALRTVTTDFRNVSGLHINDAMSSFTLDGGRIKISGVYGTPEGGFLRAEDAVAQAKFALRQYGIREDEITLLRKDGLDHVPVKLEDVRGQEGNYLVRIDSDYEITPGDVTKFETDKVYLNWFDRFTQTISNSTGSLSRNLVDAASMLSKRYTGPAVVVSDRAALFDKSLLDIADVYAEKWKTLPKARQAEVEKYLREANFQGLMFDPTDLMARGFSAKEIDTIKSWREFWDVHYYLENSDLVRTLTAEGYQVFKNRLTTLFAKPIVKNTTLENTKLFNPAANDVTVLTKQEIDDLYSKGGSLAKLRRPTDFNGTTVEYMMVRNTPTEYLRGIRDTDKVLNYRQGYFQIQYKAPKFVDEIHTDGKVKTVAVAGDTAEAQAFASRMQSNAQGGETYRVRGDDRALTKDRDEWWDVNSAGGRIAQRYRGSLLEDASGLNHLGDGEYIMSPVDSAMRAARSISGRIAARPMLEAAKARAISQYGELFPSNGIGGKRWPGSVGEIGAKGRAIDSEVADARTTWEYINYLENGYINSADNFVKATLNWMADTAGKVGLSKVERGVNLFADTTQGPVTLSKNIVFTAYIATNPLRQWVVQPHQILRTIAYNPTGWVRGSIPKYMTGFLAKKSGQGTYSAEVEAFSKFIDDSGFMASVDRQNLVRGALKEAAHNYNAGARAAKKLIDVPRQVGFDVGEQLNLLGHAAAVYDSYKRRGLNLMDKAVRDEAFSEIRAISYDMNFAGDMPYNQTSAALFLQFMQVPHKAFLQLTNRRISAKDKAKMLGGDLLLWGSPVLAISEMMGADILPEDKFWRETLAWGFESSLMNTWLQQELGDDTSIDMSSLSPYGLEGFGKLYAALTEGGLFELAMNSPAGQLFMKDGSRFDVALTSMGRYFNPFEDHEETPESFLAVMDEVLKISSGWNNARKAMLLMDAQKRWDRFGIIVEDKISPVEAWAQALGFSTTDTRDLYKMSVSMAKESKSYQEDVIKTYEDLLSFYSNKFAGEINDEKVVQAVSGRILKMYENDPVALNIIRRRWVKDMQGKESQLLYQMMKRSGIPDTGGVRDKIMQSPGTEEEKKQRLQFLEDTQKAHKMLEQMQKE